MIFSVPEGNDPRFFEAYVLAIDNLRSVCKILTDFKQVMDGVPWVSNFYDTPEFNDRVLVTTVTGYPIILGILPRAGEPSGYTPDIDDGTQTDTGNYSQLGFQLTNDPGKPTDIVSGDKIISNEIGGLFGLLKGGSFIARASKLAQILLSKYDDLVRIIGRNYELFTDSCIEVVASVRGRIYKFVGYSDTLANSRGDTYKYQEHYGDTVIADSLKWNYYGLDPTSFAALPVANDIIKKYLITGSPNNLYQQDLHLTGQKYTIVQNSAGSAYTYIDQTNVAFDVKTLNGTYTRITTTPTSLIITYNGTNTVTIDTNKIELNFNGTNIATVNATKLEFSYSGGAHFIRVDSSGVNMG